MRKISRSFLPVALFLSLLLVSSAYRTGIYGTGIGDRAPALAFDSEPSEALRALRGKFVLLCFWSSADAPSREAVGRYSSWVERQPNTGVGLLAFNFDKSEPLFREIVKRDGLNQQLQFRPDNARAKRLMRDYRLTPGKYGCLLIAPDGRIIAHNPDTANLQRLTSGISRT